MKRRGISEKWVKETIDNPAQVIDGYGGRKVAHKIYMIENKEYLLRVVYEEMEKQDIIVTAYLTSQIDRYWKENNDENRI